MERVLGVLAGEDLPLDRLAAWAHSATRVYAADGAADRLLSAGIKPHVVVGDFDSLRASVSDLEGVEIVGSTDQETSDADKLLALLADRGHTSVTLAGIEGDRLDHVLAALGSAAASPPQISFGLRGGWGQVVRRGVSLFDLPPETMVSVLPLRECPGFCITGVEWPLIGVRLQIGGQISLSNRALAEPVRVEVGEGTALFCAWIGSAPRWGPPQVP